MTEKVKQISIMAFVMITWGLLIIAFLYRDMLKPQNKAEEACTHSIRDTQKVEKPPRVYRPEKMHSEIIRSEYAREIMSKFNSIGTEEIKLLQQQAKEAWPEDYYHVIDTQRKNYNCAGHTFIKNVGPYWVFTPFDPNSIDSNSIDKEEVVKNTKENW